MTNGDTGNIPIDTGVNSFIQANQAKIYSWFGEGYWTNLFQIITIAPRFALQRIEYIARINFSAFQTRIQANNFTRRMFLIISQNLNELKTNLRQDYVARDIQIENNSIARDTSIMSSAASLFNDALDFTSGQIGQVEQFATTQVSNLRSDIFNRLGFVEGAKNEILGLAANFDLSMLERLANFVLNDLDDVVRFIRNPFKPILNWLLNNLLDILFDLLASALGTTETELPPPEFTEQ